MLPQVRVDEGLPPSGPFSLVQIEPITLDAVKFISWRMRDKDRQEISSTTMKLRPDEFAETFSRICKFGFVVSRDNQPVAVFGINEVWPGRFEAMMIATDHWQSVALSAAKEIKRNLLPKIKQSGMKLGFCFVRKDNDPAFRWAQYLGFKEQTQIEGWGKNDEAVKLMIWRP